MAPRGTAEPKGLSLTAKLTALSVTYGSNVMARSKHPHAGTYSSDELRARIAHCATA
jgi:hypothetical protein